MNNSLSTYSLGGSCFEQFIFWIFKLINFNVDVSDPSLKKTGKITHLEADRNLYPVRRRGTVERPVSAEEYVATIKDIVRLQKNVVLCRNFHSLDLGAIQR